MCHVTQTCCGPAHIILTACYGHSLCVTHYIPKAIACCVTMTSVPKQRKTTTKHITHFTIQHTAYISYIKLAHTQYYKLVCWRYRDGIDVGFVRDERLEFDIANGSRHCQHSV